MLQKGLVGKESERCFDDFQFLGNIEIGMVTYKVSTVMKWYEVCSIYRNVCMYLYGEPGQVTRARDHSRVE
jgi:hypothetical protein